MRMKVNFVEWSRDSAEIDCRFGFSDVRNDFK